MTDKPSRPTSRLSRRDFIIAGGVGVGLTPTMSGAAAATVNSVTGWDHETDVVVVGSGAAASAAALTAQVHGASVVMLEKAPVLGGTTAKSGGAFWIPNNFRLREKGVDDARLPFLKYVCSYTFPHLFDPGSPTLGLSENAFALLGSYYDHASEMTDLMRKTGTLKVGRFHLLPESQSEDAPDYGPLDGYNKAPRGRALGVLKPDGSMGFGAEMIRQFHQKFDELKVPRLTRHRVTRLIVSPDERVAGVEVEAEERLLRFRARKGVIFGSGGFAYNRDLLNRHHIAPVYGGCGVPTNTGDFIPIAAAVGASLGNMASGWRAQIVLEEALQYITVPSDVWSPPGDSMILVNKYGRRALNEKRNYHDRTRAQVAFDANRWEFPNQLMFMLYDQRTADRYAGIHPIPDIATGSVAVLIGASWNELADRLDKRLKELASQTGNVQLDPNFKAELAKTLVRFDEFAKNGRDEDFQRGDSAFEIEARPMYGLPRNDTKWGGDSEKNVTLHPMQPRGPYYAIILAPGLLDTNGGPVINRNAQVVREDETVVPGLYGAGNCIASPAHDTYWGLGGTLGPALTFGFIAGKHAAISG